jgi:hypothetical protein
VTGVGIFAAGAVVGVLATLFALGVLNDYRNMHDEELSDSAASLAKRASRRRQKGGSSWTN